jgi:hypothetical protein
MKLGMEIPKTHAEELSRLCDFDFAIAHRIVEDETYRDFFVGQREKGRTIILDNGFHERGNEAQPKHITMAHHIIEADTVISPDRIDDQGFTLDHLKGTLDTFGVKTAAVIVGETMQERLDLLECYIEEYVPTICFPYRRNRNEWVAEFDTVRPGWDLGKSIHMLGMQTLGEAAWCATRFPKGTFDTSKPIKWGYKGLRLDNVKVTHGAWPQYDTFLDAPSMDPDQSLITLYNICLLRRALV